MTVRIPVLVLVGLAAAAAFHATSGASAASAIPQTATPPPQATADPAQTPSADASPRSVWDGIYTEEQAKRGEVVYSQFCATCHGAALNGGEMAGPLNGPLFTSSWNGVSVGDLFDRVRTTMPLDRPGILTRQQNSDVLAFVFSANQFPAGKNELANRSEMLKQIQFQATKPEGTPGS